MVQYDNHLASPRWKEPFRVPAYSANTGVIFNIVQGQRTRAHGSLSPGDLDNQQAFRYKYMAVNIRK